MLNRVPLGLYRVKKEAKEEKDTKGTFNLISKKNPGKAMFKYKQKKKTDKKTNTITQYFIENLILSNTNPVKKIGLLSCALEG